MIQKTLGAAAQFVIAVIFLLAVFPGGTIAMAASCNYHSMDAWDWLLSAIVPGYGLAAAIFC